MSEKMWRCRIKSLEVRTLMFTLIVCDITSRKAEHREALLGNNQSILVQIMNEMPSKANTKWTKANGRYQALFISVFIASFERQSNLWKQEIHVVRLIGCLLVFVRHRCHVPGLRRVCTKILEFVGGPSSLLLDDDNEGSTLLPNPSFSFLTPSRTLQDCPSAVQLTATLSPNILLSEIWKCQHLENVFQGKASCVRYPFWIEQHIELFFSGCTV